MKIVSWNVNSVNVRKPLLKKLIEEFSPEVICLQETKTDNNSFPTNFFEKKDYKCFLNGMRSYNGVAIISKEQPKEFFCHDYCEKNDARHIEVEIGGYKIHSVYVPAGGDEPNVATNKKFQHKLDFLDRLSEFVTDRKNDNMVLCGDLNVAPYEDDVWSHKQLKNVVSHTDIERKKLLKILKNGKMHDMIRKFINPPQNIYTWWSYRSPNFKKNNRGRRLDHIWCSELASSNVINAKILDKFRSDKRPSDHVPILIHIN
ncbi:MAG: exodeoxyribonuclease III [Alphaproteobacteria bacterium]